MTEHHIQQKHFLETDVPCPCTSSDQAAHQSGVTPEHEVVKRPSDIFRQDRHHNTVGPHNQVSQGFSQERVQPQAHCLRSVPAAQSFAKVQLELDLRRLPTSTVDICETMRCMDGLETCNSGQGPRMHGYRTAFCCSNLEGMSGQACGDKTLIHMAEMLGAI